MNDITPELEKVARALHEHEYTTPMGSMIGSWENQSNKAYWYDAARAALMALREPTDEMVKAGVKASDNMPMSKYVASGYTSDRVYAFRAMIDYVLGVKHE